jgi:hypothetical protein
MSALHPGKRPLQCVMGLLATVPIGSGLIGVVNGISALPPTNPEYGGLDSQFRLTSAVWLSVGLLVCYMIPRIEKHAVLCRFLAVAVFFGGVGRFVSALAVGWTAMPLIAGAPTRVALPVALVLELLCVPMLALWQWRVARAARLS